MSIVYTVSLIVIHYTIVMNEAECQTCSVVIKLLIVYCLVCINVCGYYHKFAYMYIWYSEKEI